MISLVLLMQRVAIAATWLASKLEEAPRKFRDVLAVFARIDCRAEGDGPLDLLDPHSQVRAPPLLLPTPHCCRCPAVQLFHWGNGPLVQCMFNGSAAVVACSDCG